MGLSTTRDAAPVGVDLEAVLDDPCTLLWWVPAELTVVGRSPDPDEVFAKIMAQTYPTGQYRLVPTRERALYVAAFRRAVAEAACSHPRADVQHYEPGDFAISTRCRETGARLIRHLRIALLTRPNLH